MRGWERLRDQAARLMREALAGACPRHGVQVAGLGAWGSHAERHVPIGAVAELVIRHDERGAPVAVGQGRVLVSLTDEEDVAVCAWALPPQGSDVAGIGIDLASASDFAGDRGATYNHLLFSAHEQEFVRSRYADSPEMGFAFAFSAKEAAFKSLAAPLRAWYATHEGELAFEVREFELQDATHERGGLRRARAQAAMDAMGIGAIELYHCELPTAVLTLAVATRRER